VSPVNWSHFHAGEHQNTQLLKADIPRLRFREAREGLGLSTEDVAAQSGISDAGIWDIEEFDGDLTACYSPMEIRQFCRVLGIHPVELFGAAISEQPVSPEDLVRLIQEECRKRDVTLEQFEDAVGWRLSACIEPPEKLLEDLTVDGLQWLCRELRIDWLRAL
jgi:transcriptional regulator with XRE-family HTH domain